jgi:hypothetical protein
LHTQRSLCNSKYVSANKKLAIFLHFARTGASSRMLQERFQQSGETLASKSYNSHFLVLSYWNKCTGISDKSQRCLLALSTGNMSNLCLWTRYHLLYATSSKYPYFEDCRGATEIIDSEVIDRITKGTWKKWMAAASWRVVRGKRWMMNRAMRNK